MRISRIHIVLFVVVSCCVQIACFYDVRHDDTFITYRYGQNLALGRGLVFNPGERFLGATSPAHMFVSALVYAVAGHDALPAVMAAIGCVAWTAQALAIYALLFPSLGGLGAAAVACLVDLGAARSFMWVPFETNLMAACLLAALVAFQRERWSSAASLAALAVLLRPDACLLAALMLGMCLRRDYRRALGPCMLFMAIILPWLVFSTMYYGSPLPHSAVQKFQRTPFEQYLAHLTVHVAETMVPFVTSHPVFVFAWLFWLAAAVWVGSRDRALGLLVAYALLHGVAYLVLRPFAGHDWHLYPIGLVAVVCCGAGLVGIAVRARWRLLRRVSAVAFAGLAVASAARTARAATTYAHGHWTGFRHETYLRVARFLREHTRPGQWFASVEVGELAYYSDLCAYDLGGLVTDIRRVQLLDKPVRFIVLDSMYFSLAPPVPPVFTASEQDFRAAVFEVPRTADARAARQPRWHPPAGGFCGSGDVATPQANSCCSDARWRSAIDWRQRPGGRDVPQRLASQAPHTADITDENLSHNVLGYDCAYSYSNSKRAPGPETPYCADHSCQASSGSRRLLPLAFFAAQRRACC